MAAGLLTKEAKPLLEKGLRALSHAPGYPSSGRVTPISSVLAARYPERAAIGGAPRRPERSCSRPTAAGVTVATRDRNISDAALAVKNTSDRLVVAVEVGAGIQVTGLVNECGLVGDVDWDRLLEVDRSLTLAVHRLNAVGR